MPDIRFGLAVDHDNGHHVHFRVFAATGGQHLGGCGALVMAAEEYAVFRELLGPLLTDRPDPAPSPAEQDCSYRDDVAHDHTECLEHIVAEQTGTDGRG